MNKRDTIEKYNMYFFPVLLGLIAFLQSDLVPNGTSADENNQILGITIFTLILIILSSLLLYALIPKANLILGTIAYISRGKYLSTKDKRNLLTDKIDMVISYIVYYSLILIFIIFTVFGILSIGDYF